jgi:hypothetical protein
VVTAASGENPGHYRTPWILSQLHQYRTTFDHRSHEPTVQTKWFSQVFHDTLSLVTSFKRCLSATACRWCQYQSYGQRILFSLSYFHSKRDCLLQHFASVAPVLRHRFTIDALVPVRTLSRANACGNERKLRSAAVRS